MPPRGITFLEPGHDARVAAEAQAKKEEEEAALRRYEASLACVECGQRGSWFDGDFHFCKDHVPHDLYHADATFHERAEKIGAGTFQDALQQFYKRYGNPHADP